MEKPSRLLVPLAVAGALISADNVEAIEGDENGPLSLFPSSQVVAPSPDPAAFCEELRNAKGSDINDHILYFSPDNHGIEMTIKRAIKTVMEDGQEVTLSCVYDATKGNGKLNSPRAEEGVPVESFSKDLFLPNGQAFGLTVTTPNAEYGDRDDMDGFPDSVYFLDKDAIYDYIAIRGTDDGPVEQPNALCIEGEDPGLCEDLGVRLDDFDAAIAAGRKALGVSSTFESPGTESSF